MRIRPALLLSVIAILAISIRTDEVEVDELEKQAAEVYIEAHKEFEESIEKIEETLRPKNGESNSYICTGGASPSSLSAKDYLSKFAAGPCAPTIIIPGISGSKLMAKIVDCNKLRSSNPQLFKDCGWNSCKSGFLKKNPKSEYRIWIPGGLSRFSLSTLLDRNKRCFAGFMTLHYKMTESGEILPFEEEGVNIVPMGQTPETVSDSECGFRAISDTLPLLVQPAARYHYFGRLNDALKGLGYVPGLTSQPMPYDWRLSYQLHNLNEKFQATIETLYEITGKKTVLIGHSMGNFQIVHGLWNQPQEWKDKYVARYIALAPPFLGSPQTTEHPLGMDAAFFTRFLLILEVGIPPAEFKETVALYPSVWQLMPKPAFRVFQDTPWMKAIMQRIQEEQNGLPITTGTIMDLFPDYKQTCAPNFTERPAGCYTGIEHMYDIGSVAGEPMNPDNVKDIFNKYSFLGEDAGKLYQYSFDDRLAELQNTGVQTNIVYANHLDTISRIVYDKDPRSATMKNKFYTPDHIDYKQGDGVVLTTSALTPGIKWADDFAQGAPNAKPVNLIELCSNFNQRSSVFDDVTNKKVTKNSYFGIKCDCSSNQPVLGKDCNHGGMVVDNGLISFIANSLIDEQVGQVGPRFAAMTEDQVRTFVNQCQMFVPASMRNELFADKE